MIPPPKRTLQAMTTKTMPRQDPTLRLLNAAEAVVEEMGWAHWGPLFEPTKEQTRELRLAVTYAKRYGSE